MLKLTIALIALIAAAQPAAAGCWNIDDWDARQACEDQERAREEQQYQYQIEKQERWQAEQERMLDTCNMFSRGRDSDRLGNPYC